MVLYGCASIRSVTLDTRQAPIDCVAAVSLVAPAHEAVSATKRTRIVARETRSPGDAGRCSEAVPTGCGRSERRAGSGLNTLESRSTPAQAARAQGVPLAPRPGRRPPRGDDARGEDRPAHHGDGGAGGDRAGCDAATTRRRSARAGSAACSTCGAASAPREAQRWALEETRLGIPLVFGFDAVHGQRTVFPIPLAEAGGVRPGLWERTARAAAEEAAADGLDDGLRAHARRRARPALGPDRRRARARTRGSPPAWPRPRFAASRATTRRLPSSVAAVAKHLVAYGARQRRPRVRRGRRLGARACTRSICRRSAPRSRRASLALMPSFNDVAGVPMTANAAILRDLVRGAVGLRRR